MFPVRTCGLKCSPKCTVSGVSWQESATRLNRLTMMLRNVACDAVKQSDSPSAAEVDRVHALLAESLSRMYAEHKHLVPGWETRPLHII